MNKAALSLEEDLFTTACHIAVAKQVQQHDSHMPQQATQSHKIIEKFAVGTQHKVKIQHTRSVGVTKTHEPQWKRDHR